MKKLGGFVLGVVLLVSPLTVLAQQATSTSQYTPEQKQQLIIILQQLVQTLLAQLQQIIAAQQTLQTQQQTLYEQQQRFVVPSPIGASTAVPTTATTTNSVIPPQYPTPQIINYQNYDLTVASTSQDYLVPQTLVLGKFTIAYSTQWMIRQFPITTTGYFEKSNPIWVKPGSCNNNSQGSPNVVCSSAIDSDDSSDPYEFTVALSYIPKPGKYTITIPNLTITDYSNASDIQVKGVPLIFTLQVN